jgi:hypothetical protein
MREKKKFGDLKFNKTIEKCFRRALALFAGHLDF